MTALKSLSRSMPVRGCLCCPVVFRHILSKFRFSPVGRRYRVFVSVFYTPAAKCVFNRSLIGARHKSPTVEGALYTKGGSEHLASSPRSEFTTLSLISSNEVCGEHEIAPRLIQDLLEISPGVFTGLVGSQGSLSRPARFHNFLTRPDPSREKPNTS